MRLPCARSRVRGCQTESYTSKASSLPLQERGVHETGLREEDAGLETQRSLEGLGQTCGHQDQTGMDAVWVVNRDQRAGGTKPERRSLDPEKKRGGWPTMVSRFGGGTGEKKEPCANPDRDREHLWGAGWPGTH